MFKRCKEFVLDILVADSSGSPQTDMDSRFQNSEIQLPRIGRKQVWKIAVIILACT
ncbi:hypothetical protein J6590_057260 [Homalodisca vitripennis]|nr:hypothetical protein J6590_057260 [Homalodisca vitripennis]